MVIMPNDCLTNKSFMSTKKCMFNLKRSRRKFTIMIYILSKIYQNITTHNACTTRELYYGNTILFQNNLNVRKALINICCLLGTTSWNLGITLTSSGLVAGDLIVHLCDGEIIDCSITPEGVQIPQDILSIQHFQTNAKYILIVEKDASFQKMLNEGIMKVQNNHYPCIMITGKGFPDINTRLFVRQLYIKSNLPILALVDANPYGIEIMCTYRFGSKEMAHQNEMLSVPCIKWLGVHPSDIVSLNLPTTPLSVLDRLKIESLLKRPYIRSNHQILQQLLALKYLNKKAEIESLTTFTSSYLTGVYIKEKLLSHEFY
ncbi:meiotic recombination protein SPO11 [Adelges cooleyi]|uniref:meiotic recombination protein SPO11 n=1 Tax=Adelges cooleyi TaxID=133065 RepID=UPI00217F62A7|nr:meiotic recombination protein SPO11 [Adelges cooleyi]